MVQDTATGQAGSIADAIAACSSASTFIQFFAAVAYANVPGVRALLHTLEQACPTWRELPKRWLISCDFGLTQPEALDLLCSLPRSEVRVPFGEFLLMRRLTPRASFHPKLYVFDGGPDAFACVAGSANVTLGGLGVGTEVATRVIAMAPFNRSERRQVTTARRAVAWFDIAWSSSDVVTASFVRRYAAVRPARPSPTDSTSVARRTTAVARHLQAAEIDLMRWSSASTFWIEVRRMYRNRGPTRPGNQLDCPRGVRVFFGFPRGDVPPNTIFGEVTLRFGRHEAVLRTVKYGHNQMDKVNLPIPSSEGPASYDNSILSFERRTDGTFAVDAVGPTAFRRMLQQSRSRGLAYTMSGGRRFGFL